ncbi:AAA family ATPase [Thermoanaerobacterium sp. CMT5567-10]|uniref:AAA family ATPase n=1 Tax=Thermoanaerobacterium sp. CMT5567-10 TaxID=3061989 RepID=UPI0026E0B1EF|nr:AAA family ATPase [Thermoanaerobacterium sp. CMT5567-10]WKV09454.1 AAA family ATPase [Thermoanaerobacterium sp. CMT5567-10]
MPKKMIAFWSANGSTGKTTLAIAFATAVKKYKTNIVLADFKEVMPHIHKYFGIELSDKSDIYEAVEDKRDVFAIIKHHLNKKQNTWILSGISINDFSKFQEKHFSIMLETLKKEFDYVLLDTNAGVFFSSTYTALKNSDVILCVTAPTIWSIEDTAEMIEFVCERWGIDKNKFKIILNASVKSEVDINTAEKIIGVETFNVRYGEKNVFRDVGRIVKVLIGKDIEDIGHIKAVGEVKSIGAD